MRSLKGSEEQGIRFCLVRTQRRQDSWSFCKEKGSGLTSVLHSGSLAGRPGISLMAEDKLSLHEVTLLWCPTFERLASDFFSDARTGKQRLSETKLREPAQFPQLAWLSKDQPGTQVQCTCLQATNSHYCLLTEKRSVGFGVTSPRLDSLLGKLAKVPKLQCPLPVKWE